MFNQSEINLLKNITYEAGKIAMASYNDKNLAVKRKSDNSFVSAADQEVSDFIAKNLQNNFPNIEIICEEGENREVTGEKFWLIDPIDGTNSYIEGNPEFTVNIALIKNNQPVFGAIYAPAIKGSPLYYTDENNRAVKCEDKQKIFIGHEPKPKNHFTIITSRTTKEEDLINYTQENLKNWDQEKIIINKLASSLKFCEVVENKADLYLHFRKSMEWDIAAGHALILAQGGSLFNLSGVQMNYNKAHFTNQPFKALLIPAT